jgi:predicted small secreted protein
MDAALDKKGHKRKSPWKQGLWVHRTSAQGFKKTKAKIEIEYLMKTIVLLKRMVLVLSLGITVALSVTGCRTAHGFGEDMQNAGEKIQQKTAH